MAGRLRRPMRGLRRTARFARLHPPPLASLVPTHFFPLDFPFFRVFDYPQGRYITHRKFHQNRSRRSGVITTEMMDSKKKKKKKSKKIPQNRIIFFAFLTFPVSVYCAKSVKGVRSYKGGQTDRQTHKRSLLLGSISRLFEF